MGRRRGGGGDKQRWLVKDPAGVIIAVFAVGLMLTCLGTAWRSISLWVGMTSIVGIIMSFWLGALMLLVLWAHYEVMTSNPGIVPPEISAITPDDNAENGQSLQESDGDDCEESNGEQVEEEMLLHDYEDQEDDGSLLIFCDQCAIYRPPRAMHCDTCDCCIVLLDHHCPWVNNCIGIGNQKFFLLLLLYVAILSTHGIVLVATQFILCDRGYKSCGFQSMQVPGRLGSFLLAAACLFWLFCSLMLVMELYNIYSDPLFTTIADQITCRSGSRSRSQFERHLSVICGTNGFHWSWLLPVDARRTRHEIEIVQGFRCQPDVQAL